MSSMPDVVQVLASSDVEAAAMAAQAELQGAQVVSAHVWTGIIPPNSFIDIAPNTRMSTPEYFFFRKANSLPEEEAVAIGNELCGYYASSLTRPDLPSWYWAAIPSQRTTKALLAEYLAPVAETAEGKKALHVLSLVVDGREMP